MHKQVKLRAAELGMKLQPLTELALRVWFSLPKEKAFPKK